MLLGILSHPIVLHILTSLGSPLEVLALALLDAERRFDSSCVKSWIWCCYVRRGLYSHTATVATNPSMLVGIMVDMAVSSLKYSLDHAPPNHSRMLAHYYVGSYMRA